MVPDGTTAGMKMGGHPPSPPPFNFIFKEVPIILMLVN
jgi:hypothetical protein